MTKEEYFLLLAVAASRRSTCLDKQVGCILVDEDGIIIATGYNGAPRGICHCTTCRVSATGDKNLCPSAHAEQNALLYADPKRVYGCYCTLEPCMACTRMLMNTTCKEVVFLRRTSKSGESLWQLKHDINTWRIGVAG